MLYVYAAVVWVVLLVLAILNAGVRENVYQPRLGEQTGHVISTVLFVAFIWTVIYSFLTLLKKVPSTPQLWTLGAAWAAATVAFEFLFGHYIVGLSWSRLFHDYNILKGRIWVLVLLSLLVAAPVLGALMRE
ncbi:MAG: hypothetical protein U9Q79_03625 [Candidatus Hydrogenedentes bacterium]|nr:hypothetical protein [Candidatus Hydrogenedentota bacterium]